MKNNNNYHILPVSATMVGVCMTVISVIQLIPANEISSLVDKILAADSLIFIVSAIMSFWTLKHDKNADKLEQIADWIFLTGLSLMGVVSMLVAFDLLLN